MQYLALKRTHTGARRQRSGGGAASARHSSRRAAPAAAVRRGSPATHALQRARRAATILRVTRTRKKSWAHRGPKNWWRVRFRARPCSQDSPNPRRRRQPRAHRPPRRALPPRLRGEWRRCCTSAAAATGRHAARAAPPPIWRAPGAPWRSACSGSGPVPHKKCAQRCQPEAQAIPSGPHPHRRPCCQWGHTPRSRLRTPPPTQRS